MTPKLWAPMATLALVGILSGCGSNTSASDTKTSGSQNSGSQWISSAPSTKTVKLRLEAAYQNVNGGMSFDGYAKGRMTVTIPKGWTVQVSFSNDSWMPHSAMVVAFDDHKKYDFSSSSVAFMGASTPDPQNGSLKGTTEDFSFKADKAGKYALVCAVPGHASAGMWDVLVVSDTATTAAILTQ